MRKGNFEAPWVPTVKYRDCLLWAVQKRLNRSICRLRCGLGWAQGNIITWGAHWSNLANTIEPSVCGGDEAICQLALASCLLKPNSITQPASEAGSRAGLRPASELGSVMAFGLSGDILLVSSSLAGRRQARASWSQTSCEPVCDYSSSYLDMSR